MRAALSAAALLSSFPGIAASPDAPSAISEKEVLRADAYVAEYSTATGGRAVLRRRGQTDAEIEPGQLLYSGDMVEITAGRPRVAIKAPGRARPFYLPEDGTAFRVAPRPGEPSEMARLPGWVLGLFEPRRLTLERTTMARDARGADPGAGRDAAGCGPSAAGAGSVLRPAPQVLAADRSRVTVVWSHLPVARVDLRSRTGSVLASRAVAGRSTALDIGPTDRNRVDRISLFGEDGRPLMEIPVRFAALAAGSVPASDGRRLAETLSGLRTRCARRDEHTLEAISRIADLRERSLAALVVFEAIADGEVRW
ncbi:hypothetical protein [Methylobacterium sp. JK268]